MGDSNQTEEAIFNAVLELPPDQRTTHLAEACGGDTALRQRIEGLLQAHEAAGSILEGPAAPSRKTIHISLPFSEKAGDKIGHYKLLQQIGEGGCGVVYMAEQEQPVRRRVALKVIKLGMDTKSVIGRFEAERQALALMDHPNIAKVLDAGGTETGRPFFVMELVRGIKITDYCDQNHLTTRERLGLFSLVCRAIQHAHQKGIIHRDIKPSNILVTLHDGVPVPKVIDFGIAKATTDQPLTDKTVFTQLEQFIGTPAYMSPEQAEMSGLDIDTRTDIYSLGVLLYELLAGKTPFDPRELVASGLDAMRRTIREQEPARPSTRLSTMLAGELTTTAKRRQTDAPKLVHLIRGDLDWIVMKCLEKDRTRRYETANGLAVDIERHLNDEPVTARPPSKIYRLQKLVHRNKLAVAAVGAVALALILGLGLSSWLFFKEREAHHRADAAAKKSQEVAQFLKDMLQNVDPMYALKRDKTLLRDILDQTVQRLGTDLKNQPAVEAELRNTIGKVYQALGDTEKAEAMQRKALALQKQATGYNSLAVADILNDLAFVLLDQGKLGEAETDNHETLAIRRKLLGNENLDVASSIDNLGLVYRREGRLADAETLARESLAMQKKLLGNEHVAVAASLNNLALALRDEGKLEDAEKAFREALAMQQKLLGKEHPTVGVTMDNLAFVLRDDGRLAEAETLEREALAMQQQFYGKEHPLVATILNNLALVLSKEDHLAEAEALHRRVLDMRRKFADPAHPQNPEVAASLDNLGLLLRDRDKLAEAETLEREALKLRQTLFGDKNPAVAVSLNNLGLVLRSEGKPGQAELLYREALGMESDTMGLSRASTLNNLAVVLREQGSPAEAEAMWRECLAIREKKIPDDWQCFSTRSRLGGALSEEKKYAEAEPLLLSGYEGMKQRESKISPQDKPRIKEALERLAQLYENTSRPTEAAEWKRKLAEFGKS